jgi:hypothetical protein
MFMAKKSAPTTSESSLFAFTNPLPMNEILLHWNYGIDHESEIYITLFSDKSVHMTLKDHFRDDEHHWGMDNFFNLKDDFVVDIDHATTVYHKQIYRFITQPNKDGIALSSGCQLNIVENYKDKTRTLCYQIGVKMAEQKFVMRLDPERDVGLEKIVVAENIWFPRDELKVCLEAKEEDFYFESDDSLDVQCEGQMVACVESSPNREDKDFSGSPGNYEIYKIVFTEYGNFACQKVKMKASQDDSAGVVIKSQARLFKEEEGQLIQEFFGYNRLAKKLYKEANFTNIAPVITDRVISKQVSYTKAHQDDYNEFGKVSDIGVSMN